MAKSYVERMYEALQERFGTTDTRELNSLGEKGPVGGKNKKVYDKYITELKCPDPPFTDACLCGKDIKHNYVIHHRESNRTAVVGSCCIKRFNICAQRVCTACQALHRNWTTALCSSCREKETKAQVEEARRRACVDKLIEQGEKRITRGKYMGWRFVDLLEKDRGQDLGYFKYLLSVQRDKHLSSSLSAYVTWVTDMIPY